MEPLIGTVILFGGNFAPRGWAFCDGQLLAISSHSALFSILGTIYGGDGRTTFALPDMRGRAQMHPGNGPGLSDRKLGQKLGSEENTLNTTQIPSHNHHADGNIKVTVPTPSETSPENHYPAPVSATGGLNPVVYHLDKNTDGKFGMNNGIEVNFGNTGGGQAVNNMQPWECINFIIALEGLYPSRS